MTGRPAAILLAGPTASGKSAIAIALARRIGGVIINADSMQVYADLAVLTARPGPHDLALVPHLLYGHVDGAEPYSTGRYLTDAAAALAEAERLDRVPIFVGGTGLYFHALENGLSPVPEIPSEIRAGWRDRAAADPGTLHQELAVRDPVMAGRLPAGDTQRIVRALEVIAATGRSLAEWQQEPGTGVLDGYSVHRHVLSVPREVLYRRCDSRFRAMIDAGAIGEIDRLRERNLPPDSMALRAIGVSPLMRYRAQLCSLEEAIQAAQMETRRYVKRQQTWAKQRMIAWNSHIILENSNYADDIVLNIASSLDCAARLA